MTTEPIKGSSIVSGPPQDWSGAWVRATATGPAPTRRPEIISSFLSEHGGAAFVYQPIFDATRVPASLHALEGLVRGPAGTPHEDPEQLLEFFRCRGHLQAFDFFCLEAALADAAPLPFDGSLVVNVEAVTVASPAFDTHLLALAQRSGIDPSRLILDVRIGYEEAPMGRLAVGVVRTRAAGVRVCFDEARASASPVSLLEAATPDFVKLSRNRVRSLWRDPWTRQCVEGMLRLGEELGFQVIAQGIESDRDLDAVKRCGISIVQGHLLGSPKTADALAASGGLFDVHRALSRPVPPIPPTVSGPQVAVAFDFERSPLP